MTARPMTEVERAEAILTALKDVEEALTPALIKKAASAYHQTTAKHAPVVARALLSTSASLQRMREALGCTLPLAEIALEACRDQRCRAGHHDIVFTKRDGVQWVGLYQDEYDRLEKAKEALAALSGIEPGDEQARGQGRSAPASTLSKDTTK